MQNTLNEILFSYVEFKKNYLKESTYVRYLNLINNHIRNDIGKIEFSNLSNKLLQEYCDKKLSQDTSVIVIKEIVLLIKLALKRYTKINCLTPFYIDLDLPVTKSKKKYNFFLNQIKKLSLITFYKETLKNILE